jgi:hypothetical protein
VCECVCSLQHVPVAPSVVVRLVCDDCAGEYLYPVVLLLLVPSVCLGHAYLWRGEHRVSTVCATAATVAAAWLCTRCVRWLLHCHVSAPVIAAAAHTLGTDVAALCWLLFGLLVCEAAAVCCATAALSTAWRVAAAASTGSCGAGPASAAPSVSPRALVASLALAACYLLLDFVLSALPLVVLSALVLMPAVCVCCVERLRASSVGSAVITATSPASVVCVAILLLGSDVVVASVPAFGPGGLLGAVVYGVVIPVHACFVVAARLR